MAMAATGIQFLQLSNARYFHSPISVSHVCLSGRDEALYLYVTVQLARLVLRNIPVN